MGRKACCDWTRPVRSVSDMRRNHVPRRRILQLAVLLGVFAVPVALLPSFASSASVASLALSGGAGTIDVGGTLYAKSGGAIGVDIGASADSRCVRVFENGAPVGTQSNPSGSDSWHFDLLAPNATGVQQMRATAYATPDCHGAWGSSTASFIADNTGPRVSAFITPSPTAYGWNNSAVRVLGRVSDGGMVGVAPGSLTPRLTNLSAETSGAPVTISASDLLGNPGTSSVLIRIDKTAPSVSVGGLSNGATYTLGGVPSAGCNASDSLSGIDSCSGSGGSGDVGAHSYTATAEDRAGNTASAHVSYHVAYDFHWAGANPTSARVGSTITLRVQLLQADGTAVRAS